MYFLRSRRIHSYQIGLDMKIRREIDFLKLCAESGMIINTFGYLLQ